MKDLTGCMRVHGWRRESLQFGWMSGQYCLCVHSYLRECRCIVCVSMWGRASVPGNKLNQVKITVWCQASRGAAQSCNADCGCVGGSSDCKQQVFRVHFSVEATKGSRAVWGGCAVSQLFQLNGSNSGHKELLPCCHRDTLCRVQSPAPGTCWRLRQDRTRVCSTTRTAQTDGKAIKKMFTSHITTTITSRAGTSVAPVHVASIKFQHFKCHKRWKSLQNI